MIRRAVLTAVLVTVALVVAALPGIAGAQPGGAQKSVTAPSVTAVEKGSVPGWMLQTTPKKLRAAGQAAGISCSTPTSCVAVGSYQSISGVEVPLSETWDGNDWTLNPTPTVLIHFENDASNLAFTSVSCNSSDSCEAVGWSDFSGGNGQPNYSLAASWNGSTWSLQNTPNVADPSDGENDLTSVSCVNASLCSAVGWDVNPEGGDTNPATMAELWNGTNWTVEPTPALTGTSQFNGVSCASATECVAVGTLNGAPLSEIWDGSVWTVQPTPVPNGATSASLASVSCSGTASCDAVGSYATSAGVFTLAENFDGTNWTFEISPEPDGATYGALSSISCAASGTGACTAVGTYDLGTGVLTLAESWDGTSWNLEPTPDPSASQSASLAGVACVSNSNCQAVGTATTGGSSLPISESFSGNSWSPGNMRSPGFPTRSLSGISCQSATDCQAVGSFQGQNLAQNWNGANWSIEPTSTEWVLGHIEVPSALYAVSCPSSSMCVGAGETSQYMPETGLVGPFPDVSMWSGSSWVNQSLLDGNVGKLTGVSCPTTTACVAVGFSPQVGNATIESWNGTTWKTQLPAIPAGGRKTNLKSVSCMATTCTAVGTYTTSAGGTATLIETRTGKTWTVQPSPSPTGAISSTFKGISCTSASACTAVGSYKGNAGVSQGFAESWNGTSWSLEPVPSLSASSTLNGISCTSVSACTAVGTHAKSALLETWDGTSWTVQAVSIPNGAESSSLSGVSCEVTGGGPVCSIVGTFVDSGGMHETLAESTSGSAPFVGRQPWNEFVGAGATAIFTAIATGAPTPSVKWQVSTDAGGTWTALSDGMQADGSVVSGSSTGNLVISHVQRDENGDEYEAIFSNSSASAASDPASLGVS